MSTRLTPTRRFAATMTLAVASAFAVNVFAMPGGPGGGGGPGGHAMGGGPLMGGMLPRMLERINATPEQRAQIKVILDGNAADRGAQREAALALRTQAMALFTQPTVDANEVEALRLKQMALRDDASKRMSVAMIRISQVLTLEQRKQMADYMTQRGEMMRRHYRERRGIDAPKN